MQSDGKVLIGCSFNFVNGVARNYIARLNSDGTLDTTFNIGSGADALIYAIGLQADAKVVIGGGFTEFNGTNRNGIARLQNSLSILAPTLVNPVFSNNTFRVSVATMSGKSHVQKSAERHELDVLACGVPGDGTTKPLADSTATVARQFYRVQVF